ncbi:MAG: hypothetical protein JOY78_11585 [Pseudonocardia sp.]|nr:hypothetical protein [Pseudonocardia sp.]
MFHLDSIILHRLYAFFVIEHAHPPRAQLWVAPAIRLERGSPSRPATCFWDLNGANRRFRFLIRDRDSKFTAAFDTVFTASDIRIIRCRCGHHVRMRSPSASWG